MRKIQKRYYILIFVAVVAAAVILREINTSSSFEIIKNPTAYAPEAESVLPEVGELTEFTVNINTASIPELSMLEGIGEGIAEKIVEYRTKHGNFEVIQDIMKVSGIGDKKFEAIKSYITVE